MYSDIESFSSDERGHMKKAYQLLKMTVNLLQTNKPMMEKKRRARINHCLSELKEILICDKHAELLELSIGQAFAQASTNMASSFLRCRRERGSGFLPMDRIFYVFPAPGCCTLIPCCRVYI
ncbi:Helix-loop-helix DNA-binding domain protein [Ancylostoma caninum]|uniref:Helix-loop-helix DNA-binding domain protein n=1 Tax=Ancylostoma caninum TaxID=29170 RepID=A0A368G1R8_ANCCA|nr:Helix-loop-helix DNA-binding domain protein [Ancylostoma caninum]